jgi:hypothetical protein
MGGVSAADVLSGRFEVIRRIGAGGLAEVFAARDRTSGAQVAIKILHAHLAEDRDLADRFRREMSVTRALDHPAIVRVFDLHEHEGRPFFSMELLQGQTLQERLLGSGALEPGEARRIARDICAALQASHRAGVVHRDLKPQNVFITGTGAVKLLDFGLARVAGQTRLTSKTAVPGTPGYIAPELLLGQRADPRADLYSLGATFFEMLTGRRPFVSSDPYDLARLVREAPPRDRQLDPRIGPEDEEILRRALDKVRPLELFAPRAPIDRVLDRLGGHPASTWKWRLLGAGQAVLVSGASRRTAEAVASVCAEHGLPATVRSVASRPRFEEWIARNGSWALALFCAFCFGVVWYFLGWDTEWGAALGAASGYVLSWGLRPPPSAAPLAGQPGQDSSMARLADGIARRAERLQRERPELPAEMQGAVDRLVQAAGDAAKVARKFTAAEPDVQDSSPSLRSADLLTLRLLEIAAALDDALTAADGNEGTASALLRRIEHDAEVAQHAMPDVRALEEPRKD